jgi:hypothetical protein
MADITSIEDALFELETFISIPVASKLTGVTKVTIITWCKKYKIGRKVGGRWKVDPDKLTLLLKGGLIRERD